MLEYKINYIGGAFTCNVCKKNFDTWKEFNKHLTDTGHRKIPLDSRHRKKKTDNIKICSICHQKFTKDIKGGFTIHEQFENHLDYESHRFIMATKHVNPINDNYLGKLLQSCNQRKIININIPSDREDIGRPPIFEIKLKTKRNAFLQAIKNDHNFICKIVTMDECLDLDKGKVISRNVFATVKNMFALISPFNNKFKEQQTKNFKTRDDDFLSKDINDFLSTSSPGGMLTLMKLTDFRKKLFLYEILGLQDNSIIISMCDEYRKYYGKKRNIVALKGETNYSHYIKANPDLLYLYELCRIFYITIRNNILLSDIVYEIV